MSDDALITELIGAIYDGAMDSAGWERALALMVSLNGGGDGAIMEVRDSMLDPAGIYMTSNIDPAFAASWQETYSELCPYVPLMVRDCPPLTPVLAESLIGWSQVAESGFGRDWMCPQGMGGATGGIVELSPSRIAWLGLSTPLHDAKDWQMRARTLQLTLPHWARAFQINRQVELANARAGLSEAALNRMTRGVIVTDARGRVVIANLQATALAEAQDGLGFGRGGLVLAAKLDDTKRLQAMIHAVAQDPAKRGAGGVVVLERPSGKRPLSVLVTALPGQPAHGAMLIIGDAEQSVSPLPETLARR
jgi:PAS domain-containing protein